MDRNVAIWQFCVGYMDRNVAIWQFCVGYMDRNVATGHFYIGNRFRNVAVQYIIVETYSSFVNKCRKYDRNGSNLWRNITKWCDRRGAIYRTQYVVIVRLCVVVVFPIYAVIVGAYCIRPKFATP